MNTQYSVASELLYKGESIPGLEFSPEAMPLFETTAFTWKTLSEAKEAYGKIASGQDFTYIRTCNPNRQALAEVISYLENGEKSIICSSGMGAITSTLLTFLKPGDHVVYGSCCYGRRDAGAWNRNDNFYGLLYRRLRLSRSR